MSDNVFLAAVETVEDCEVLVTLCEAGSVEPEREYYTTDLGRISLSQYRYAKQKVMASEIAGDAPVAKKPGRLPDHDYGVLIDLVEDLAKSNAESRRVELARKYKQKTGRIISDQNKRLKKIEKWARIAGSK
ncbi:hypothetical protein K3740_18555 [Ruegeria conchae]|uniref:hypothetical protein n=1 Tax=Ruegeria conchae TaxID=981384 RepID=UPI0021A3498D|nr:hypothetical protein [Ruegeria conchae]UWR03011.1 hypothetical protein K3740_18555 [Ruegeria conchae]